MKIEHSVNSVLAASLVINNARLDMTDSPRIPYILWPLAFVLAFIVAYITNAIEKNWRGPKRRRRADWRQTIS